MFRIATIAQLELDILLYEAWGGSLVEAVTVELSNEMKLLDPKPSSLEVTANVRKSEIVTIELGTSK